MARRHLIVLYMLLLIGVGYSCKGDPAANKKTDTGSNTAATENKIPDSNNQAVAPDTKASTPSTGKKHLSIDTSRNENQPLYEKDRTKNIPAPVTEASQSKPIGPPGYVTKDNAVLLTKPVAGATKVSALKKNEIVFILQTIMTDENGQVTDYPTWYRIERKSKQTGWVIAKAVDAGAGG
ncbi:MAG: hypothetical protein IT262_11215 [Saprospiraceae bacterium]|nr:hypothetical protein [Saprospiraceae bacterium]